MEKPKQYITIGIYLHIWRKLMQLKLDKNLRSHNDVLEYLLRKERIK